jgi:histone H3/H4
MALVVMSKIKALIKKQKMNTAGDFAAGLDKVLQRKVEQAIARAKHNKRKTVRAGDL